MNPTRRTILSTGLALGGAAMGRRLAHAQDPHAGHAQHRPGHPPASGPAVPQPPRTLTRAVRPRGESYRPVVVPNGWTLPFERRGGVKVFHLVAEAVEHRIARGLDIHAWGYNGGTPGPMIEAVEGDRVRIYVENRLPEPTTVHWHGMFLPSGMDGVAGLSQPAIPPGKTFKYEFTLSRPGTFMYHPHFDEMTQIALGMVGMFVVHPRGGGGAADRDYSLMAHEWKIEPGAARPDPMAMSDFNVLTFNSVAFPETEPLVAEVGDRVRIRLGNLGPMDHHPIHLHGYAFHVTETDGGPVPRSARLPETTVLVPVGQVRVIEFVADAPGDWAFHCHMTHHVMNQMGHDAPNLVGADVRGLDPKVSRMVPGYMTMGETGMGHMSSMGMDLPRNSISMRGGAGPHGLIDMGGMFTILKVRQRLEPGKDPGWYEDRPGDVASEASASELRRDGVTDAPRRRKARP